MALVTVHYHELALKGGNRPRFARALRDNVQRAVAPLGTSRTTSLGARLLIDTEADADAVARRAARVCGVAHVMKVLRFERDLEVIGAAIVDRFAGSAPGSFRITTRRADKGFALTSVEVNRQLGAIVHEATGIPVSLRRADTEVFVSVLPDCILVAFEKLGGPGGLPVGTGGKVAALMSGGIDSPVAAWRMMKRGCRCDLIHFHSHPLVDRTTQEKARDLAEILNHWQFRTRLYLVPLAAIQTEVRLRCPEAMRVVLYRRFMLRIAQRIARRRRCRALVTGESLGQVASQTLENLATVEAVATLPVLRPLIGMDKQEIIAEAERLETYPVSVRPDQDCCQLFVPPHPATRATAEQAAEAEAELEVDDLVRDAQRRAEIVDIGRA